jgi:hypothetical protein
VRIEPFKKMSGLNEWAKWRTVGLVIMAQQLAVGAESCFEFLRLIKSGDRIEAFSSLPKAKEWVRLYRSHRRMQRSVVECLRRFGGDGELAGELAEGDVSAGRCSKLSIFLNALLLPYRHSNCWGAHT